MIVQAYAYYESSLVFISSQCINTISSAHARKSSIEPFSHSIQIEPFLNLTGLSVNLKWTLKVKHTKAIDVSKIAAVTTGSSGAQLANIVNQAAIRAVRMGHKEVDLR